MLHATCGAVLKLSWRSQVISTGRSRQAARVHSLVGDWPAAPVVSRPPLNRATGKLIMMQVANEPAHERLPARRAGLLPLERSAQGKAAVAALR